MFSNRALIETLIREGRLKSPKIIDAFTKIDRIYFVPEKLKGKAYTDEPLPIGFGQTISQPLTVAFMLELLNPEPGEKILEIGAGSGWKTALLAHIVSKKTSMLTGSGRKKGKKEEKPRPIGPGRVIAVERIKQLHEKAVKNVSRFNFIENGVAKVIFGDGSKGYHTDAPFDKIIAGAAGSSIPSAWKEQVRIGGRIVIPIEDTIKVIDKLSLVDYKVKEYYGFKFVPLVTGAGGS